MNTMQKEIQFVIFVFLRSIVFRQEIEDLLKLTSFKLEALCGTFDKKPHIDDSREMIFVAGKS